MKINSQVGRCSAAWRCCNDGYATTILCIGMLCLKLLVAVLCVASMNLLQLHVSAQQQDPMSLNGGSVLAMAGKDCVALAVDKRFGFGNRLVNICPRPILLIPSKPPQTLMHDEEESLHSEEGNSVILAFTGLEGDIQTLMVELTAQINNKLNRGLGFQSATTASISPSAVASLTSHLLYHRKRSPYYVEPLVVGLEKVYTNAQDFTVDRKTISRSKQERVSKNARKKEATTPPIPNDASYTYRPYLCSMDVIGAKSQSQAFVCAGVASKSLFGTAEAYWKPNLSEDELVEICGNAFLSALERDCLSGYGALIYLIKKDGTIIEYDLECRND